MEFYDVIKQRVSVRSYKKDKVEQEKLNKILEAAILAPTVVNFQPFKIFVIKTYGREEELKKIYHKEWFCTAPYVIGLCVIKDKCWVKRDGKSYGDVDAAIVMDHIILTATDLGLGTCWVGAFDASAAKKFLKLDDNMEPVLFTPLGYPDCEPVKKPRKKPEELIVYI